MYRVAKRADDRWACEIMIQDGTERWVKDTFTDAIQSVVTAARIYNGTYIHPDDIQVTYEAPVVTIEPLPGSDLQLIQDIKRGEKVVLAHNDKRVKYRLTDQECDLIIKIREGDAVVTLL